MGREARRVSRSPVNTRCKFDTTGTQNSGSFLTRPVGRRLAALVLGAALLILAGLAPGAALAATIDVTTFSDD